MYLTIYDIYVYTSLDQQSHCKRLTARTFDGITIKVKTTSAL